MKYLVLPLGLALAVADPVVLTTGVFDTNFGRFTLTATGGAYDDADGRVTDLEVHGNMIEGRWSQAESSQQCADGSYSGRFHLEFSQEGFTGTWGWCDGPLTAGVWTGTRR